MFSTREALKIILDSAQYNARRGEVYFSDPKLRFLTKEQAEEWLKITSHKNVHTLGRELSIMEAHIENITSALGKRVTVVDLGCGDGRKAVQFLKLLISRDFDIIDYFGVDINQLFIDETKRKFKSFNGFPQDRCKSDLTSFEDVSEKKLFPWRSSHNNNDSIVYLFFGNTYNNYEPTVILNLLSSIMDPNEKIIIGSKLRRNSSPDEIERIINQYKSYGNSYTYGFGRLLGLKDKQMERVVKYNHKFNRLEVWIEMETSVEFFNNGLKVDSLLTCVSYKPTIDEIVASLNPVFNANFMLGSDGDSIFLCAKNTGVPLEGNILKREISLPS